ncbi:MAG: hypothetical protein IKU26_08695 [Clostridia bacterium]|nr:hypothetical protein [Clostridia bacterium]
MSYHQLHAEERRLSQELDQINKKLPKLPAGRLTYVRSGHTVKWYHHLNGKRIYIPKSNRKLAVQLALKRYLQKKKQDITRKMQGLHHYLKTNAPESDKAPNVLTDPNYADLLADILKPIPREIAAWEQAPYAKSTKYPNQLRLQTVNGLTVRSKSESIIALCLYTHRIPFHYEERLTLSGVDFYPDFTLRHPQTGETFYWEHVGRPDDSVYRASFLDKLNLYLAHGIIPDKNLILTWETADHPLSTAEVEQQIQQFLQTTL